MSRSPRRLPPASPGRAGVEPRPRPPSQPGPRPLTSSPAAAVPRTHRATPFVGARRDPAPRGARRAAAPSTPPLQQDSFRLARPAGPLRVLTAREQALEQELGAEASPRRLAASGAGAGHGAPREPGVHPALRRPRCSAGPRPGCAPRAAGPEAAAQRASSATSDGDHRTVRLDPRVGPVIGSAHHAAAPAPAAAPRRRTGRPSRPPTRGRDRRRAPTRRPARRRTARGSAGRPGRRLRGGVSCSPLSSRSSAPGWSSCRAWTRPAYAAEAERAACAP